MNPTQFAQALLAWFDQHGRHQLPWQQRRHAYPIWISEIMLQQTQVATVLNYFPRFIDRFPTLPQLAAAPLDAVLTLWSGLGYYQRARNLHACAQRVVAEYGGQLPPDITQLAALPGIGRSTAGAILALAHDQRHPILDGNVRRVLCRYYAIAGWPGRAAVQRRLWQLAEQHTPMQRVAAYTQAMMDLGATLCRRSQPACHRCPLADGCAAHATGSEQHYPEPKPRRTLAQKTTTMLLLQRQDGALLLQQRPPVGIWGGLWSLPEWSGSLAGDSESALVAHCQQQFGCTPQQIESLPPFRHTFTHFHLDITPLLLQLSSSPIVAARHSAVLESPPQQWYKPDSFSQLGMPAPVRRLLSQLMEHPP